MIRMQYIIDKNQALLTLVFDEYVIKKLKAKCDDNLYLFQSPRDFRRFSLVKADTGYRIKKLPREKKTYQVNIGHKFENLNEFEFNDCIYFIKRNGIIRIKLCV